MQLLRWHTQTLAVKLFLYLFWFIKTLYMLSLSLSSLTVFREGSCPWQSTVKMPNRTECFQAINTLHYRQWRSPRVHSHHARSRERELQQKKRCSKVCSPVSLPKETVPSEESLLLGWQRNFNCSSLLLWHGPWHSFTILSLRPQQLLRKTAFSWNLLIVSEPYGLSPLSSCWHMALEW